MGHVGGGGKATALPLFPTATMRTMNKNEEMARWLARVLTWTTNGTMLSDVYFMHKWAMEQDDILFNLSIKDRMFITYALMHSLLYKHELRTLPLRLIIQLFLKNFTHSCMLSNHDPPSWISLSFSHLKRNLKYYNFKKSSKTTHKDCSWHEVGQCKLNKASTMTTTNVKEVIAYQIVCKLLCT